MAGLSAFSKVVTCKLSVGFCSYRAEDVFHHGYRKHENVVTIQNEMLAYQYMVCRRRSIFDELKLIGHPILATNMFRNKLEVRLLITPKPLFRGLLH